MTRPYVRADHAKVTVAGTELDVLSLKGTEGLSTMFTYEVKCAAKLPLPPASQVVGGVAVITIMDGVDNKRIVTGIVAEAHARVADVEHGSIHLTIRPDAYSLTLGRDCYDFQEVNVVDVMKDVLADYKGPYRFELTKDYPQRPYIAQYREDDWSFISRLMEEEGIYYWFDHDAASAVVFSDDSTAAPDLVGGASMDFVDESGLVADREHVHQLVASQAAATQKFSMGSFDMRKPAFKVAASMGGDGPEFYDAPGGGSPDPAVVAARTKVIQEATAAAAGGSFARTASARPYPGRVLDIQGHPAANLGGRLLITSLDVSVAEGSEGAQSDVHAIPVETPYRAPLDTPPAKQAGLQIGEVVGAPGSEVHPDELGRLRVRLRWDRVGPRDDTAGTWMRAAQRGAPGSMLLPRVNWNVATFNEEGGVDAPSITCRIHDGEHLPSYSLPDHKTKVVYKTATTPGGGSFNEIYFDGKRGQEEMFINASKDMNIRALNVKQDFVWNDQTRKVGNNHTLEVVETQNELVVGNQDVTIGGNEDVKVLNGRSKTVAGNEIATVGGSRKVQVGTAFTETVQGNRDLKVGAAMLDLTMGNINLNAQKDLSVLVGGAHIKLSAKSINEDVGVVSLQTIGGAKIEIAKQGRPLEVDKLYAETVGGLVMCKVGGRYIDNADTVSSWRVGAEMKGEAPELWIEAIKSISIKCGDSVLRVTEDAIVIEAASLDLSGAQLEAVTDQIDHNA